MNVDKNQSANYTDEHGNQVTDYLMTYSEEERQANEINAANAKIPFEPEFIPLYRKETKHFSLSPSEARLYGFLRFYFSSSTSSRFYFTNEQLAETLMIGESSVTNAVTGLTKKMGIKFSYKIKAGGGTFRIINSDQIKPFIPTPKIYESDSQKLGANKNNINKKKVRKEKDSLTSPNKVTSIKNFTPDHITSIAKQYSVEERFVLSKLEDLKLYCETHGKRYKNYYSALQNFVKKDSPQNKKVTKQMFA